LGLFASALNQQRSKHASIKAVRTIPQQVCAHPRIDHMKFNGCLTFSSSTRPDALDDGSQEDSSAIRRLSCGLFQRMNVEVCIAFDEFENGSSIHCEKIVDLFSTLAAFFS
jgi:hypothetical protein